MALPQYVIKESGCSSELFGFEEVIKTIEAAIERSDLIPRGNFAIIAEPFSGRSELLCKISDLCTERATKIPFGHIVKDENFLQALEKSGEIVLVDDCHLLYSRKIGGFEKLDLFLDAVASSRKLFITTWSQFSWNYLRFIFPLERIFPNRIELPRLGVQGLKEMIMVTGQMNFAEEEEAKKEEWLELQELSVDLGPIKKTLRIPVPRIDLSVLRSRFPLKIRSSEQKDQASVEDRVFQRLRDASEGNPGVAKAIWERSVPEGKDAIKPGDIEKIQYKIDLNYDQAFMLYIILCMESISPEELKEMIEPYPEANRFIHELDRTGLISVDRGVLRIQPEALHSVESYLKSVRLVS
jgi:hypothetical protein